MLNVLILGLAWYIFFVCRLIVSCAMEVNLCWFVFTEQYIVMAFHEVAMATDFCETCAMFA